MSSSGGTNEHYQSIGTRKPSFVRIIMENMVADEKLLLPRKFVRQHADDLSNFVLLKVPSGAEWPVRVMKRERDVWLTNGWREFASYYSLRYCYLLMFEYEGNSKFAVVICDARATEIDYPVSRTCQARANASGSFKEPEIEDSDEELPFFRTSRSDSTRKRSFDADKFTGIGMKNSKRQINSSCSKSECKGPSSSKDPHTVKAISKSKRIEAFKKQVKFRSKNPYFIMPMQPTYLRYQLRVPTLFSIEYLKWFRGRLALTLPNGNKNDNLSANKWDVEYYHSKSKKNERVIICDGWNKFVKENSLTVDDVCVFELIEGIGMMTFRVYIFREVEYGCGYTLRASSLNGTCNFQATSRFESEHPLSEVPITPASLDNHYLNLGKTFLGKKIYENDQEVKLLFENGIWRMKICRFASSRYGRLTGKWKEFAKENSLREGDICKFELINESDVVVVKLTVTRKGH